MIDITKKVATLYVGDHKVIETTGTRNATTTSAAVILVDSGHNFNDKNECCVLDFDDEEATN